MLGVSRIHAFGGNCRRRLAVQMFTDESPDDGKDFCSQELVPFQTCHRLLAKSLTE